MTTAKGPSLPPSITRITLFFALGAGLALLAVWLLWNPPLSWRSKEDKAPERFTETVLSAMPALVQRWREGDLEGHYGTSRWNCPELPANPAVAPGFFQCNPHYLECWARGLAGAPPFIETGSGEDKRRVRLKAVHPEEPLFGKGPRHGRWITRAGEGKPALPVSGLWVELEVEGQAGSWPVVLEDCRGVPLEERRYSYGPRPERHERVVEMDWDNEGRRLFIDKYLVSRADLNQWILAMKPEGVVPEADPLRWPLPAVGLTPAQQTAFCAWHGKRRLDAHLWDAATMLPGSPSRPFPDFVVKPWLPWTRDRRGTFFEAAGANPDWAPRSSDCALAHVGECEGKFPYRPHQSDNVAWSGVYHVLGGEPERFRNVLEPTLTVRASSRRLPAASSDHQLGRRRADDGSPVGFRCYREALP